MDTGAALDPYLFCMGVLLLMVGLSLSQLHRDEGIELRAGSGLPFNILRKTSGAAVVVAVVLGFWVIGPWWVLWAMLLWLLSASLVLPLKSTSKRLPIMMTLMCVGLVLTAWAQAPTLTRLGLF